MVTLRIHPVRRTMDMETPVYSRVHGLVTYFQDEFLFNMDRFASIISRSFYRLKHVVMQKKYGLYRLAFPFPYFVLSAVARQDL
jgi:hypothetical protein